MRIEAGFIALQSSNAVENEKLVGKCEELVVRSNFYQDSQESFLGLTVVSFSLVKQLVRILLGSEHCEL